MHYIALDTCTWIYLANGTEPVKHLSFIMDEVDKGNIIVVIPQTVIDEWNRHKSETVTKGTLKFFRDTINSLEQLAKLLGEKGEAPMWSFLLEKEEEEGEYFADLLKKVKNKKEQIEKAVKENIQTVERIFNHPKNIRVSVSDKVKLMAGEYALEKKAPFNSKNSFADAIIVFSFLEFIEQNKINDAKFISYNTEDFCKKEGGRKFLHPDLQPLFDKTESKFYKIVGEALNTIEADIVSVETLNLIRERQEQLVHDDYDETYTCEICDGKEGLGNIVYFGRTFEVDNENEEFVVPEDQLDFGFDVKVLPSKNHDNIKTVQTGVCEYCNQLHIKCEKCDGVTPIVDYNTKIECNGGCGTIYFVASSYDYEMIDEYETVKVLDPRRRECEGCGTEFIDLNEGGMCEGCENKYAYGD